MKTSHLNINEKLIIHHVGGRAGSRSFPILDAFEKDIVNVLYEADESCVLQVAENWSKQSCLTKVLPYCLSEKNGTTSFNINYDPYTSSIYPMNPRYASFYYKYPGSNFDYVIGDTFRTIKNVQIPTITLDTVVIQKEEVPSPDYLSIDTQGSELDILKGALECLDTTILAVCSEVSLHQIYEGQPLLGDICLLLSKYDFDLVDVKMFNKLHPIRGKNGFRGEGYDVQGEALFLKRPKACKDSLQLHKLAYIATVYGQFECAQQCFESADFEFPPPLLKILILRHSQVISNLFHG